MAKTTYILDHVQLVQMDDDASAEIVHTATGKALGEVHRKAGQWRISLEVSHSLEKKEFDSFDSALECFRQNEITLLESCYPALLRARKKRKKKESLTWGTGDGLSCENCDSEVPLSTNADGDFVCMACGMVAAPGNDWEAVEGAQEVCPRCGGRMSGTAEDAYCKNCAELGGMASL